MLIRGKKYFIQRRLFERVIGREEVQNTSSRFLFLIIMYNPPSLTKLSGIDIKDDIKKIIDKLWKYWKYSYTNRNNTCFPLNNYIIALKNRDISSEVFTDIADNIYLDECIIPEYFCLNIISGQPSYWNTPSDYHNNLEESIFNSLIYNIRLNCRKNDRIIRNANSLIYKCLAEIYDRNYNMLNDFFDKCKLVAETKPEQFKEMNLDKISKTELSKLYKKIKQIVLPHIKHIDSEYINTIVDYLFKYNIWLNCLTWEKSIDKYNEVILYIKS